MLTKLSDDGRALFDNLLPCSARQSAVYLSGIQNGDVVFSVDHKWKSSFIQAQLLEGTLRVHRIEKA